MNEFQWCDAYCINLKNIDDFQKQMLLMINHLHELKTRDADAKSIAEALTGMMDFARNFFKTEERMLSRYHYPGYQDHRKEHREFIKRIVGYRRWFTEDTATLTDEVFDFFKAWVAEHILQSDKTYAPFIRLQMYLDECKAAGRKGGAVKSRPFF